MLLPVARTVFLIALATPVAAQAVGGVAILFNVGPPPGDAPSTRPGDCNVARKYHARAPRGLSLDLEGQRLRPRATPHQHRRQCRASTAQRAVGDQARSWPGGGRGRRKQNCRYLPTGGTTLSPDADKQLDLAARLFRDANPVAMFVAGHADVHRGKITRT